MNLKIVPKIAKPCPANWDDMQGDDKRRFCEHCQLHVHNLSAMPLKEQREVLTSKNEHKCITYIASTDAIQMEPAKWLNWQANSWTLRKIAAIFVTMLSFMGASCQSTTKSETLPHSTGGISTPSLVSDHDAKRTMGAPVMPLRPFWKKLLGLY